MKSLLLTSILLLAFPVGMYLRSGENISLNEPVDDDVYVAGGTVIINAPIHGDLIVAGGNVTINDSVEYDLIVAGGSIILNGYVGDDIRCTGGTIQLTQQVNDDVVIAGGEVTADKDAVIGGNLMIAAGKALINGRVEGQLMVRGGEIEINGLVEQDADVRGEQIKMNGIVRGPVVLSGEEIEIGPEASFLKDVRYWSGEETAFGNSVKQGNAQRDESIKIDSGRWELLGFTSVLIMLWYLGTALLMIFLIQYLFGTTLKRAAGSALKESLKSIGYGVLFCVGLPLAVVLSFITIIGIPVSMILLFAMITLMILATVVVSLVGAHWINEVRYASRWSNGRIVLAAFGIFIVLKLITFAPFVGPLVMMLLIFMAFGSILLNVNWKRKTPATA